MLAGVSTACYYPALLEDALQTIADADVEAAEVFINSPCELQGAYLRSLRQICRNTRILSLHPFTSGMEPILFFSDYRRRFYDGIEIYKRFFEAAGELGAKIVVFHGNRRESVVPYPQYFDYFGELALIASRMGVTLAQENVPRCTSWQPYFFQEMSRYLPNTRYVLDVKQCIRAEIPLEAMVHAMGPNLVHLHVSDHSETHDCLPVGKGDLDLEALLRLLHNNGFDGGVILEVYRDGYGEYAELEESYRKILHAVNIVRTQ